MYVLKDSPSSCVENKVWGHRSSCPLERILQVDDDDSWDQRHNGVVQRGEILGPIEVGDDEMQGAVEREGSEFIKHQQCAKHGVESQVLRIR